MTTDEALKRLEATGQVDTLGVTNPGMIIDLYNDLLKRKREKQFGELTREMNSFYIDLLIDTVKQRSEGVQNPIYKSPSILVP